MDYQRTPPIAAFFSLVKHFFLLLSLTALLISCGGTQNNRTRLQQIDEALCQQAHTPISSIQGRGFVSPLQGSQQTILATVTHISPSKGFFVEQALADDDPNTSDGLWIESASLAERLNVGDQTLVNGTVAELGDPPHSLTSLTGITSYQTCLDNHPLPLHETGVPMDNEQRESLEGMRVQMQQNFVVTNVRDALTRSQVSLSMGGRLISPTEREAPGENAATRARQNSERSITLQWTDYADPGLLDATPDTIFVNDSVFQFSGILSDTQRQYIVVTESFGWIPAIRNIPKPIPRVGNLRIASLNLLNYFNGDGNGGGFSTRRGAKNLPEFEQQRERLISAMLGLNADVIGLMELENDGYGPDSAIQDLVSTLVAREPDAGWRFANPQSERLGSGSIAVGFVYKHNAVRAQGPPSTLNSGTFERRSRQPLAQRFVHSASGMGFMVVVNHFKSKGSCPADGPDSNLADGQSCWNQVRVRSATELDEWLNSLSNILAEQRIVVLGDFNAMRMEDPIKTITANGWIDLVARFSDKPAPTYNFRGEAGTLDYIFASESLVSHAEGAAVWPINADYPIGGTKDGPTYLRSSDHNPLIADFSFISDE